MNIRDFKNKKVLIMGLGLHGGGAGAARFFAKLGSRVFVTDLKTKKDLAPSLRRLKSFRAIQYRLGKHKSEDFKNANFVVKNPGVPDSSPYLAIAKKRDIPVLSDIEIFFLACPAPIAAITGTKGKSTATWLLVKFLEASGKRVWIGGNIRNSVLEFLKNVRKNDVVVLELSSFQLDSLANSKKSPHIAVITNIFPDHLNRYGSMRAYRASKANIFRFQNAHDYLFINGADSVLKKLTRQARSKIIRTDARKTLRRFAKSIRPLIPAYHRLNIALAVEASRKLGAKDAGIRRVLKNFKGIPGRMELVGRTKGVDFINDTTATNPEAGRRALQAVRARIGRERGLHAIIGGFDKGLPLKDFIRALIRDATTIITLPGNATKKMKSRLQNPNALPNSKSKTPKIFEALSMQEAVEMAYRNAKPGDVVLLSPGAASFGLFKHEFDRGEQFEKAVDRLRHG